VSDENLSPEEQAEAIFAEEYSKIDLNGEDCPQGDACAIHHRQDEEVLDDELKFGRLITYVDEYVVITTDNPQLENPVFLIKMVLGQVKDEDIPPMYETCVLHVGDGALADLRTLDQAGRKASIRFVQTHDDWENLKSAHEVVVNGVEDGLIDVSKPAEL
jgi:hypothetical protein